MRKLRTMVLAHEADLGIAFDGDGDLVDESGAIVWPDQVLLLLAGEVLRASPEACIVGDVKSSRVLFDGIARLGGRPVMAPHRLCARTRRRAARVRTARRGDERAHHSSRSVGRERTMRSSPRCGCSIAWGVPAAGSERVDTTDGLRVTEPDGRWLLRASGTEPKLTIRCEAADEPALKRLRLAVGGHLQACGIKAS
jgi:phosphomannomutase